MFFGGSNFQQQNVYARNSRQFQRNTTADEGEVRVLTELFNWVFGASSKNNIFFCSAATGVCSFNQSFADFAADCAFGDVVVFHI